MKEIIVVNKALFAFKYYENHRNNLFYDNKILQIDTLVVLLGVRYNHIAKKYLNI